MKRFIVKIIDIIARIIYPRIEVVRLEKLEIKKYKLISKFQSVGFGLKLNGEKWAFISPDKILIGNNVHIGDNAFFHGGGGLTIADNTHISRNVTIYTSSHEYEGIALPYDSKHRYKAVTIEQNVWIGMNVSIRPGVTIGEGSIIGIGCVVDSDVPPLSVVVSNSSRILKYRNREHYSSLNHKKRFGGINGKLLNRDHVAQYHKTYYDMRDQKIVFIASTGRSGSTTIVDLLNSFECVQGYHEDIRQFIHISKEYSKVNSNKINIYRLIDSIFKTKIWQALDGNILVHSDQKFWNLIPFLSNYFPNSKFIHLKRAPIPCIKSMVARGWYEDSEFYVKNTHDWAEYRIRADEVGDMSLDDWNQLSQIQKCAWYYYYVNNRIQYDMSNVNGNRCIQVDLEDLSEKANYLEEFLLGVRSTLYYKVPISNKALKRDQGTLGKINELEIMEALKRYS